jgi:CheY-like chemotaxis protein
MWNKISNFFLFGKIENDKNTENVNIAQDKKTVGADTIEEKTSVQKIIEKLDLDIKEIEQYGVDLLNYDPNKKSILIVDDNIGITNMIEDDLEILNDKHECDFKIQDFNILIFTTKNAIFNLRNVIKTHNITNIVFGIFDINIGGAVHTDKYGNIIYDGIDGYYFAQKLNTDMKHIFLTANNLKTHINKISVAKEKYKWISGEDLKDNDDVEKGEIPNVLYKTVITPKKRQDVICSILKTIKK